MIGKWLYKQAIRFQVFLYRSSGGKIMGAIGGMPLLLLTTTGRKTGEEHTTPVMYIRDGNAYVITASNNGSDKHPAWFWNIKTHPQTTIQVGSSTIPVTARQASPEEKTHLWAQLVKEAPGFEKYKQKTTRDIPMVILLPATVA